MLSLAIKIWFKGVVVFSILCAILIVPTFGIVLLGLFFGLLISLLSIPFYTFIIFLLKRSESTYGNALFFLFITTIPAVLIALSTTILIDNSNPLDFHLNRFYANPTFLIPWTCAAIGIRFARKPIKEFFGESLINNKSFNHDISQN